VCTDLLNLFFNFIGCFCPGGKLLLGDQCVEPLECSSAATGEVERPGPTRRPGEERPGTKKPFEEEDEEEEDASSKE